MEGKMPERIQSEAALEEILSRPRQSLVADIRDLRSPLLILGASGKLGPTLALMARRAAEAAGHPLEIIAASRFSDGQTRQWLESRGVRTIRCDFMEPGALAGLPESENVIYLVGVRYFTAENPALTWAVNTLIPARIAERYPHARLTVLSSGNVYPDVPVQSNGSVETDPLTPVGEYGNSCVARERILEYYSQRNSTPLVFLRLSHAVELRYGVLVSIARQVYAGEPVDVTVGYMNWIWQGDANEMILRSLALTSTPPTALNLTGRRCSTRDVALRLSELMGRPVHFVGQEAEMALLSDTTRLRERLGEPSTSLETALQWIAHWVMSGGRLLSRPSHP